MGSEIDRLEIQVEAQAASANKQLDALATKLNAISKSLSGINGGGMKQFAEGMNRITAASKTMATIKATEINRVVLNLQKLSKVNSGNMFNVGNALKSFASGLSVVSSVNVSGMAQMTSSIAGLSKIGNKGVQTAIASMPKLASAISGMMAALNVQTVNTGTITNLTAIANAVSVFGQKRIQTAIATMPQLATALKGLMSTLSAMPNVSSNLIQMTNALANLAAQGTKTKSAVNAIKNVGASSGSSSGNVNAFSASILALNSSGKASDLIFKRLATTLSGFVSKLKSVSGSSRSLAATFGSFYANCFWLIRGIKALGKTIGKSMDYVETYNYFNVTMDKIGKGFGNQFEKYGYDSAEAYADSFSSRLNDLTEKMSGYKVGSDGVLSFSDAKNLSLDPEQLMQYQSNIAAVTNSVGLVGETSVNAAKALSMLSADMSSLKNIDMSTVMTNFQSGLIGQSRALYKYGIDITNATLQTYAYKYGLSTAVSEMTQADKMQLRLLAILDQSKVAWGDQANTINSVANQYRIFKQQISNVARMIGNLFIPVLQAILPVVNGVLIAFQKLVVFIGKLFGIDYSKIMDGISGGYGGADDAIGDIVDETGDIYDGTGDVSDGFGNVGDSIDDANEKAKKLQRTILGFDEINKLNDASDNTSGGISTPSGSGGSGSGIGGGGGINLADDIAKALAEYEKVWNDALQNSINKAKEYADKITGVFNKMWKMIKDGDFKGLGEYIAGGVNYIFDKINSVFNWDKLGPKITKFVDAYCDTVNGLVDGIKWYKIGKTIGDGINVITNSLYRYLTGIDWVNIGKKLAEGLNGVIHSIDWDMLGRTIGAWIMKIPKMIYGFVTKLDWKGLGKGLGEALNGALKEFDGKMIAEGINGIVNGILTAIKSFIRTVDWGEVAKAVGDVLGNLDWGALAKVGLAIGAVKLVAGLASLLKVATFEAITKILTDKIAGAIGKISLGKVGEALAKKISKLFEKSVFAKLGTNITKAFKGIIPIITKALSGIGVAISGAFTAAAGALGISVGALVAIVVGAVAAIVLAVTHWDEIKEFFTKTVPNWWNKTVAPWIQGLPEFFKELPGKILEKIIVVKDKFVEWASGIIETVTTEVPKIIDNIVSFFAGLPEKIGYAIGFAVGKLASWASSLGEWIAKNIPILIENIATFFKKLPSKIWDAIISAKDRIVEWANQMWEYLSAKVPEIISGVVNFFIELPDKIWDAVVGAVASIGQWCKDLYDKIVEEVPKIVNKIVGFFASIPDKLLEIGKNIVRGFINGIKGMWNTVKREVKDFVDGIVRGFKDGFDVHSPSRVMYGIGENVVAGFSNAISEKWKGVQSNLKQLCGNAKKTVEDGLSGISDKAQSVVSSIRNALSNIKLPHINVSWSKFTVGKNSFSLPNFGINWYAKGGFPDVGQLFIAREKGPEMVGSMGGRSAVANNDQIVDGIKAGVYPAVYDAMVDVMSTQGSGGQAPIINVYVGGRKITDVFIEEVNKITKSAGRCPILT